MAAMLMHACLHDCDMCADQDSVRLLAVESCSAFAQALSREDAVQHLLPVIMKFAAVGAVDSL